MYTPKETGAGAQLITLAHYVTALEILPQVHECICFSTFICANMHIRNQNVLSLLAYLQ